MSARKSSHGGRAAARGLDARLRLQHHFMPAGDASLKTLRSIKNPIDSDHGIYRDAWLSVVTVADDNDRSIQQTRLAHALGNPFGVCRILEWQPINMIFQ
jgi:hypothetical protein